MKFTSLFVSFVATFFISLVFSATPAVAAGVCEDVAVKAAKKLFKINTRGQRGKVNLVHAQLIHSAGAEVEEREAYDVYDIVFEKGGVLFAAYRIQVILDDCQIIRFEIPSAG